MLLKLIKHELKSYLRTLKFIYLTAFIIFLINTISFNGKIETFNQQGGLFFMFLLSIFYIIFLFVFVTFTIVKRYAKTMFGEGGYLTNTLPINPFVVILSKVFAILITNIFTFLFVVALVFMVFVFNRDFVHALTLVIQNINLLFKPDLIFFIKVLVYFLISSLTSVLILITTVTLAHLRHLIKHKYIFGILIYFVINYFYDKGLNLIISSFVHKGVYSLQYANISKIRNFIEIMLNTIYFPVILYLLTISIIAILLNTYLVKNHLNLE